MVDAVDRKILRYLQKDARMPNSEIAKRIGMAASAIFERTRKLESRGVIKAYEARLDANVLDCPLVAFVFVRTSEPAGDKQTADRLVQIPEVQEVHNVAGEDCYLLKVRTTDPDQLGKLLRDKIGSVPTVVHTRTTIVMETFKETVHLPFPEETELPKKSRRSSSTTRPAAR